MRKLIRLKRDAPSILTDLNGEGYEETNRAIEEAVRFIKGKSEKFSFKFDVYRNANVRQWLINLSSHKCAYCEEIVTAGFDGDIEHFRPKGEVVIEGEKSLKPGYYWLAAHWENLFLSCVHCNQSRVQLTPDGRKLTMGKKNQFPLTDNKKRVKSHKKDYRQEKKYQLLLDPCKDEPAKRLKFDETGNVHPLHKSGIWFKRAEKSIEVFALFRKNLVEQREKHAKIILQAIVTYNDFLDNYDRAARKNSKEDINDAKRKLSNAVKLLKAFCQEDQRFSTMAYQLIKDRVKHFTL